ncbi:MAG: PSD1 and planctomycete cytochrome C domain-containing protein [Akkermansiaceae bacterium]
MARFQFFLKPSAFLSLCVGLLTIQPAQAKVSYQKEVAPILADNCLKCHGEEKQKSALRLDQRPLMLKGGDSGLPTIVPGKPEKSFLIEVISDPDHEIAMPPKGDPLTKDQIATLTTWIAEGAEWPGQMDKKLELKTDHWSFQPVTRPQVPAGSSNAIDAFLSRKLTKSGLSPNKPADAQSLIQRVHITLTGLPPTPEEVANFKQAFKANPEKSYSELLDSQLASPHFGERWAQHWLDVIRWAETNGSESNLYRKNAWTYRDYVIHSFNKDIPYSQFITEQLAGDQLGAGEATGFLVAGPHVPAATVGRQPTAIRQARADRVDEVMQTIGASIMGVTVGCARCHNHKFDPISIQDYYSLTAIFQGLEFGGRIPELSKDHPRKKRAAEIYPLLNAERKTLRESLGIWEENWGAHSDLVFPNITTKKLRVEFLNPKIFIDELEVFGPDDFRKNLARQATLSESPAMLQKGSTVEKANDGEYGTMVWKSFAAKGSQEKPWVEISFPEPTPVNRFRFSGNREYYLETDYLSKMPGGNFPALRILAQKEDGTWQHLAGTHEIRKRLNQKPDLKAASNKLHSHIATLAEEGPQHSFVGRFSQPAPTKILHRGSPENPRDEVPPAGFAIMKGDLGMNSSTKDPIRRKKFAAWLTKPDHPLTSRVMVNRIWHHLFGTGIVPTTADFGIAGAKPSHPELLDWLASEYIEKGWSTKTMIKEVMLTDAFRRSSLPESLGMQKDANSTLLWRFPPRRVEAEVIRDGILQASGKLEPKIGGRSFRIHNVKKTYAQWEVTDNHGPDTWRRMIYQERMRRVDDQIFTAFDFPDCGQVRAKRPVSTTPLQALNLLNSPFVVEQSKLIAERAQKEYPSDPISRTFQLILKRSPTPEEKESVKTIPLNILSRSLINSNEFAFLP